jgi:hypothetical protein
VQCNPDGNQLDQTFLLCKLCLVDVPSSIAYEINQCGCAFCKDVSKFCLMLARLRLLPCS